MLSLAFFQYEWTCFTGPLKNKACWVMKQLYCHVVSNISNDPWPDIFGHKGYESCDEGKCDYMSL